MGELYYYGEGVEKDYKQAVYWLSRSDNANATKLLADCYYYGRGVEPDYDNEIAEIFSRFPQLNVSEVAKSIGIHKSLLSKYIYGVKKPSLQRKMQIKEALRTLGQQLIAV